MPHSVSLNSQHPPAPQCCRFLSLLLPLYGAHIHSLPPPLHRRPHSRSSSLPRFSSSFQLPLTTPTTFNIIIITSTRSSSSSGTERKRTRKPLVVEGRRRHTEEGRPEGVRRDGRAAAVTGMYISSGIVLVNNDTRRRRKRNNRWWGRERGRGGRLVGGWVLGWCVGKQKR